MFGLLEGPSAPPPATFDELAAAAGIRSGASQECPALAFARSGAMWLTGTASPAPIDVPLLANLQALCDGIEALSGGLGRAVRLDPATILTQRAADRGFRRQGRRSANGTCRLLPGLDGWLACNLARPSDLELLPAILGGHSGDDPWEALAAAAASAPVAELVARAQLVGVAAAQLDDRPPARFGPPVRFVRLGPPGNLGRPPRVLDFSALWAGPLCAHVLGQSGALVWTAEDRARPDGARLGYPRLYHRLHQGHRLVRVDFASSQGRSTLAGLLEGADVVVESSRPRALAALGLTPEQFLSAAPGRVWISVTGYGRRGDRSNHVAFGDDAAVAGGLVAWEQGQPVFCADAVGDPVSGLVAAIGGLLALAAGGGLLVDVSMRDACAAARSGPRCPTDHPVEPDGRGGWVVAHRELAERVMPPDEVRRGG